ncbi:MAG: D-glycero-beta-D-manno-heptose-7-phosphate kinase [Candidatus Aminicenantes bacterium]|nr:MAG: D-glycero-beta-D-manno-heptose-7-phosphate kinase [Candidatus Aminicenantes bacterium]
MIKLKRVEEICSQFEKKRILVFGDVILDRYIFGNVNRISPEAPVPVVKVEKEEFRPGGAGNVAANVDKLGARGLILGITGDDVFADQLFELKVRDNVIIKSNLNQTLVKTRVISRRQQIVRIDREEPIRVTPEIENRIFTVIKELKKNDIHGIIISDYAKGTLTRKIMECLKNRAQSLHIPIIVDPKPPNFHLYKDIDGITPNRKEAETIVNKKIEEDMDAAAAVKLIRRKFRAKFSVITRGDKGITAGERGKKIFHLPAFNHEVFDVTGAGDTVVSVLLLSLVSGADLREAAALSNGAASIVVEKVGTSQVTLEELHQRMKYLLRK